MDKRNIRLVASDIDGTILRSDQRISDRTVEAIRDLRRRGIQFALCTGRSMEGASKIMKRLDLYDGMSGIISINGLMRSHYPYEVRVTEAALTEMQLRELSEIATRFYLGILYCFDEEFFFAMDTRSYADYRQALNLENLRYFADHLPVHRITGLSEVLARRNQLRKVVFVQYPPYLTLILPRIRKILEPAYDLMMVGSGWGEVMPPGVSKATGLAAYAQQLGIDLSEVMVFGDAENDCAMLREAGVGVAMANAMDSAKAAADVLTLRNDEDGVAVFLEAWFASQG